MRWTIVGVLIVSLSVVVEIGAQDGDRAAGAKIGIPDFDTTNMQPLVRNALDHARKEVIGSPKSALAWSTLAVRLDAHDLFNLAKPCYWRAHELDGSDFRYIYLFAVLSDFTGSPAAEVIPMFEKASKLEDDFPPLYVRMAGIYLKSGDMEKARWAIEKALAIDGEFASAHFGCGQYHMRTGDFAKAVEHLEKALAEAPDDRRVNAALARAYARVGEREKATRAATEARKGLLTLGDGDGIRAEIKKLAVDTLSLYDRAKKHYDKGRYQKAIRDMKEVVKVRPHDASAQSLLGRSYSGKGNEKKAVEHMQIAVNLEPKYPIFHYRYAEILLKFRKPEEARKELDLAIEIEPQYLDALMLRGICRVHLDELDGAKGDFEKASGIRALSEQGYLMWGVAYAKENDLVTAVKYFRLSTETNPKFVVAWTNLAYALEQLGDVDGAIDACRKVLEFDPQNVKIKARLDALVEKKKAAGGNKP